MGLEWETVVNVSSLTAFFGIMFLWLCTMIYAIELTQIPASQFLQAIGYAMGLLAVGSGVAVFFYVSNVEERAKKLQEKMELK